MKTPPSDCPAAHSMDTEWFAVDEQGRLGVFFSDEQGAVPVAALADPERPLLHLLAAELIVAGHQPKWRRKVSEAVEDVALVAAEQKSFRSTAKEHGLTQIVRGAPAVYSALDLEPDDVEELLEQRAIAGFATSADVISWLGVAEYEHAGGAATGEYARRQAPRKAPPLPKRVRTRFGRLKLPVDFAKARTIELWRFMDEDDVEAWESGLTFAGADTGAAEAVAAGRRFELSAGSSNKFWHVRVEGPALTVRFGRIGTEGQERVRRFSHPSDAIAEAEKLIGEKARKGYQEVTEAPTGAAEKTRPHSPAVADPNAPLASTWRRNPLSTEAFEARFGLALPPRKQVWVKATPAGEAPIEEAMIDFGASRAGVLAREEVVRRAALWWLSGTVEEPLPSDFEGIPGAGDLETGSMYYGVPSPKGEARFAQEYRGARSWLRLVRFPASAAPERAEAFAHALDQKDQAAKLLEQLIARAGKERVRAIVLGSGTLELFTVESLDRAVKKLSSRSILLCKSKTARATGLGLSAAAAANRVDVPWEVRDAMESRLRASTEALRARFGTGIRVGRDGEDDEPDLELEAWNALTELKPDDVIQAAVEDRAGGGVPVYPAHLDTQLIALLSQKPAHHAPALARALLKNPRSEALLRLAFIFREAPVRKMAKTAGFVKDLKALLKKVKPGRVSEALHALVDSSSGPEIK